MSTKQQPKAQVTCNVQDCVREPVVRGLCDAHWASRRGEMTRE